MNTRKKAITGIVSFINSDHRVLLLTGTYQNEKHVLALHTIFAAYEAPATILFRVNHSRNIDSFLSRVLKLGTKPRTGLPIKIKGNYTLYVDTTNPASWDSSSSTVDIALVYPIDSLGYNRGDDCVKDLLRRNAKKILLVSWTDNKDFGWVDQFSPVREVYDAEEERPDYHRRVLEFMGSASYEQRLGNLPQYAQSTPNKHLVKILCRGLCNKTRWAKLNRPYPGKTSLNNARAGEFTATCLKCSYEARDNYNWYR